MLLLAMVAAMHKKKKRKKRNKSLILYLRWSAFQQPGHGICKFYFNELTAS